MKNIKDEKRGRCEWEVSGTFQKYTGVGTEEEKWALVVCKRHGEVKEVKIILI
jgi:hypothetical protein